MATYYVSAAGNDSNDGLSEGTPWLTVAQVEGSEAAGDTFKFRAGDRWRERIDPPTPGTDGNPVTYTRYGFGANPIFDGSDIVTGWTLDAGNRWQASFTVEDITAPTRIFFDGTRGTLAASQATVDAENEWYYDAGATTLYVYSTSDPDSAFTAPGIEAQSREHGFRVSVAYITVDGIDCIKTTENGIKIGESASYFSFQNLILIENGNSGFLQTDATSGLIARVITSRDNGVDGQDHGLYINGNGIAAPFLLEDIIVNNNSGVGLHIFEAHSGTARRILAHNNGTSGIIVDDLQTGAQVDVEYFISYGNGSIGARSRQLGNAHGGNNRVRFYNGAIYANAGAGLEAANNTDATCSVEFKNIISLLNTGADFDVNPGQTATLTFNYNCYFRSNATMIDYDGITYSQAQFATYQSATGQDAMSISADPLFVDVASFDFHLRVKSPCINAGVDVGLRRDFAGTSVPRGRAPDIGAYEFERHGSLILGAPSPPLISPGEIEIDEFWEGYFQDIEKAQQS